MARCLGITRITIATSGARITIWRPRCETRCSGTFGRSRGRSARRGPSRDVLDRRYAHDLAARGAAIRLTARGAIAACRRSCRASTSAPRRSARRRPTEPEEGW